MAKDKHGSQKDILDEHYRGPNGVVSALGYGAIETKLAWLVGLVGGGALAFIFHEPVNNTVRSLRGAASHWVESENRVSRFFGKVFTKIIGNENSYVADTLRRVRDNHLEPHEVKSLKRINNIISSEERGIVHALSEELLKIPGLRRILDRGGAKKVDAAIMGGGLTSIAAITTSTLAGSKHGYDVAEQGKNQFKRAQQEVKELREDLDFIEQKNAELRNELRVARTDDGEKLNVARDDTPKIEERPTNIVTSPMELDVQAARKDDKIAPKEQAGETASPHPQHTHHTDASEASWSEHMKEQALQAETATQRA
jgi:hypothetical protein